MLFRSGGGGILIFCRLFFVFLCFFIIFSLFVLMFVSILYLKKNIFRLVFAVFCLGVAATKTVGFCKWCNSMLKKLNRFCRTLKKVCFERVLTASVCMCVSDVWVGVGVCMCERKRDRKSVV